jgi:3D (Asp-Asp-Asp) domain-containing protein
VTAPAPTPTKGAPVVETGTDTVFAPGTTKPAYPPVPELPPFIGSGRPKKLPRRRLGRHASAMLALVAIVTTAAGALRVREGLKPRPIIPFAPALVFAPILLDGALVRGAAPNWAVNRGGPLRYGDPVPVWLTAYCLRGLTRRDHYAREGIVASDPKIFPLGRYLEVYVGKSYFGRFLIDDTGGMIKGNKLDIWTPTCREARVFGRVKGTAVLVPRPRGRSDTLTTGRLGGAKRVGG